MPDSSLVAELRQRIAAQTGLPPAAIRLAAWQTHSARETLDLSPRRAAPGAREWLERHLAQPADTAHPVAAMTLPLVSADDPGAATALVERALAGSVYLFADGCAGNINSIHIAANFTDVEAIGRRPGRAALECVEPLKAAPRLGDTRLVVVSQTCTLEGRRVPPPGEAKSAALSARFERLAQTWRQDRFARRSRRRPSSRCGGSGCRASRSWRPGWR